MQCVFGPWILGEGVYCPCAVYKLAWCDQVVLTISSVNFAGDSKHNFRPLNLECSINILYWVIRCHEVTC